MSGKPKVPKDLDSWLTDGFTASFYANLERFTRNLYKFYNVNESWDYFYDNVRTKIEEILTEGVFTPTKGTFKSFIYSMVRNEATKANSKNKRRLCLDDPAHEYLSQNLVRTESSEVTFAKGMREDFIVLARARGEPVDHEVFEGDLCDGRVTPMVLSYLWLLKQGGTHGIGL